MLGAPVATTGLALGRYGGGMEGLQITAFGSSAGKLRAGGPGTFRSEGDYMAARDLSNFHLSDEKTEAQEEKGSWPRKHSVFFPASSTEPFARASGVVR